MCAPPWVHPGRFHTVHVKKSPKDKIAGYPTQSYTTDTWKQALQDDP